MIEEEGLQEHCAKLGTYFITQLGKLREQYEIVGDVRGKGLMIGLEMVATKDSKTPLPAASMAHIWETTKDLGLLIGKGGYYGNVSVVQKAVYKRYERDNVFAGFPYKTAHVHYQRRCGLRNPRYSYRNRKVFERIAESVKN